MIPVITTDSPCLKVVFTKIILFSNFGLFNNYTNSNDIPYRDKSFATHFLLMNSGVSIRPTDIGV